MKRSLQATAALLLLSTMVGCRCLAPCGNPCGPPPCGPTYGPPPCEPTCGPPPCGLCKPFFCLPIPNPLVLLNPCNWSGPSCGGCDRCGPACPPPISGCGCDPCGPGPGFGGYPAPITPQIHGGQGPGCGCGPGGVPGQFGPQFGPQFGSRNSNFTPAVPASSTTNFNLTPTYHPPTTGASPEDNLPPSPPAEAKGAASGVPTVIPGVPGRIVHQTSAAAAWSPTRY